VVCVQVKAKSSALRVDANDHDLAVIAHRIQALNQGRCQAGRLECNRGASAVTQALDLLSHTLLEWVDGRLGAQSQCELPSIRIRFRNKHAGRVATPNEL